jgi:diguanylate cyclase (GGDEF)-like protein
MLDIDHFKTINDRFGHHAGDEVLRGVVDRVQSVLRAGAQVGRYGGEEFLVVLPDCSVDEAVPAAERLRHAIAELPFAIEGHPPLDVRVSIGVSTRPGGEGEAGLLIQAADRALYRAKESGRDRVEAEPGYSVIA